MPATDKPTSGRPWALTVLWVLLMTPLSLAGAALQTRTGLPGEVLPLVMAGPAVAAAICALVVPRWFPAPWPPVSSSTLLAAVTSMLVVGGVFAATAAVLLPGGPAALPPGWRPSTGVAGVVVRRLGRGGRGGRAAGAAPGAGGLPDGGPGVERTVDNPRRPARGEERRTVTR